MWIATSFGFLMPAIRPPHTVEEGDERTLQVRARRAKDLDILRAEYMKGKLGPTIHTPSFDYEYRAYCTPEAFAFAMAEMIRDIDYTKFKPTTDRYHDHELHSVYNRMWAVILDGLSTKKHQFTYWNYHKDGKKYAAENRKADKKPAPYAKKATGTKVAPATVSGTGYPKALPGPTTRAADDTVDLTDELARLNQWYEDADRRDQPLIPGHDYTRNTSADRDEAARIPDVVDVEWSADDEAMPAKSLLAEIDALYDEIDELLDSQKTEGPIEHSKCGHALSDSAKNKCRARHRRANHRRIEELREEIDKAFDEADAQKSSDPDSWKGFVWEGGKHRAAH